MFHNCCHSTCKIITVQISVQHISITGINIAHGNFCYHFICITCTNSILIIIVGICKACLYRVTCIFVCIQTNMEFVITFFQYITAMSIGVKGSYIICTECNSYFFRLTSLDFASLGITDQCLCRLLKSCAFDTAGIVCVIWCFCIKLYNLFSGSITCVGYFYCYTVFAVCFQFHIA